MISENTVMAIIPARGGSKGVSRKNIREIGGKPLIGWTIEEAKKSQYIDRLILSSDDKEIIDIGKKWGCEVPFVRPQSLAQDNTPGIAPVLHAIKTIPEKYDYLILLQPTSPLRKVDDIDGCLELCIKKNAPVCVSVSEPDKNPYWMFKIDDNARIMPVIEMEVLPKCRQELPRIYAINGAVYVAKRKWIEKNKTFFSEKCVAYIMDRKRSLDIDDSLDLQIANCLISTK